MIDDDWGPEPENRAQPGRCLACNRRTSDLRFHRCGDADSSKPRVYSMRQEHQNVDPIPPSAVYVGRAMPRLGLKGSEYGNPFKVGRNGVETPEQAVRLHRLWVTKRAEDDPSWLQRLREQLRGEDLACWCQSPGMPEPKPPCHATVLLELANGEEPV